MATHISLRLAWHNNSWNGHICKNPGENTYCSGNYSYPGDIIRDKKDLAWESQKSVCGMHCSKVQKIPPCAFSINAFGKDGIKGFAEPPEWFYDDSKGVIIDIPASTACTWYYEGMYSEDVENKTGGKQKFNYDKRLSLAKEYFSSLQKNKSLIFYYANYSNPFNQEEEKKYVIVGISRLKKTGDINYYENVSETNKEKYAGGFVWQMPITSDYPNQGFVLPYEKYMNNQDVLSEILFVPENTRNFKYATRVISDDDALSYVEKLLEIVKYLIEIKDDSQDWEIRKKWLLELLDELWKNRGPYPGMMAVLDFLNFQEAKEYYKTQSEKSNSKEAYKNIFDLLNGKTKEIPGLVVETQTLKEITRNWNLQGNTERQLLEVAVPRIELNATQVQNIISEKREENNLYCSLGDILVNPYFLSENYAGDDVDDFISFNKVDHGVLPSPDLGLEKMFSKNSAERFRALCVEQLRHQTIHSFVSAEEVIARINNKLGYLPDWKSMIFNSKYLEVDEEILEKAIKIKSFNGRKYLYLNYVYEDERNIQNTLESFAKRSDIALTRPFTKDNFVALLKEPNSSLLLKAEKEYTSALEGQAAVCQKVFNKNLAIISGAAGTGKTTIIKAIINAIEKVHGMGSAIYLLAPTGKASERIKEKTEKSASTIHSFLAGSGWLNSNFTFKRNGGVVNSNINTLIIDECSMIDLDLFAVLFRAINWNSIQRLILVGDPNQLPPIGRGKVFYEIIEWLKKNYSENLGMLDINVRQLENSVANKGNGILNLANIYIQEKLSEESHEREDLEIMLKKLQEGDEIEKDLKVFYWKTSEEMEALVKEKVIEDIESDSGMKLDNNRFYEMLDKIVEKKNYSKATYQQVISPFRSETYGVDNMNIVFQKLINGYFAQKSTLDGIALFDKVIQIKNRPKSNQIYAYNTNNRGPEPIEIYNGEIGHVKIHPFDKDDWKKSRFRLERFQVIFNHKENYWVGFGKGLGKTEKGRYIKHESPEENLELGYVLSVHKAQGSEFERVYLILPQKSSRLLSMELLYTAITRAKCHLTIFVENDVSTFLSLARKESSILRKINSSLFGFNPLPDEVLALGSWYPEGKIYATLSEYLVRSKSEVIISNLLSANDIPFSYEMPLYAKDGTMFLPDFTVKFKGETYYWEHLGRLDLPRYQKHWQEKERWYHENFPGKLIVTKETNSLTKDAKNIINQFIGI